MSLDAHAPPINTRHDERYATTRRRHRQRAFSLIELAVVLIVIAVIAAIAIPTYQQVIDRSDDHAAVAEQEAIAREVLVLIALGDAPEVALNAALTDASTAAPGVTAASGWVLTESTEAAPGAAVGAGEVSWAKEDPLFAWAAGRGDNKATMCLVSNLNTSTCWSVRGDATGHAALGGPVTADTPSSTTTTVAAPTPPADLDAHAGDRSVTLTWPSSSGAAGYTVYLGATNVFAEADVASSGTGTAATITELVNGAPYWFWVVATGPGGTSAPAGPVNATPTGNGVFLRVNGSMLEESSDGLNWERTTPQPGVSSLSWVSAVDNTIIVGSTSLSTNTRVSEDRGATWADTGLRLAGNGHFAGAGQLDNGARYMWRGGNQNIHSNPTTWAGGWGTRILNFGDVIDVANNGTTAVVATANTLAYFSGLSGNATMASGTNDTRWGSVGYDGTRFVAIASNTGGAWRTSTDGVTWAALPRTTTGILHSAIDGANGTFVAIFNGWVIRSTDGGETWANVVKFGDHTTDPDVVTDGTGRWLASTNVNSAVHQKFSDDDGLTWTTVPIGGGTRTSIAWLPYR